MSDLSSDNNLGAAGKLAKTFITSPLSILFFLAMLGAGIIGLISTPRQEDPQISVPLIDIFISYPGATSKEVADITVRPLSRLMSHLLGVKHVYSVSDKGRGIITVEFDVGEEMGASIIKVRDKIHSNMDLMPEGVRMPIVKPKEIDDVPIVNLTLWSKQIDDGQLRLLGLELLQQLESVKDTNNGFVVGGRKEVFNIDVYPERLAGYNISLQQIANAIKSANIKQQTGKVESYDYEMQVYSGDFFKNSDDIKNITVAVKDNKPIYIRDIANVYYGVEETEKLVSHYSGKADKSDIKANGEQAVTVAVAKKYGSNGVTVANDILKRVEELKGRLIPDNVHITVSRNYGKTANDKVNGLIRELFIATGIVTFLVWVALGARPALVIGLVIPVVLLMTLFSAWILGLSIDRVSLFALIFSIGILVDDATVVVENIYRRWLLDNRISIATAIDAVREVGNPTILATFTIIAALLPMAAVRGMMGPYMMPIPILGSVAMLFSLFAAFVFAPYFVMKFVPSIDLLEKMHKKEDRIKIKLQKFFNICISNLYLKRNQGKFFLIFLVLSFFISISMFYATAVAVKMLPLDNKSEFGVLVDMPDGTALSNTTTTLHKIAAIVKDIPEVKSIQLYAGTSQPFDFNGLVRHYYLRNSSSQGELQIQLLDKEDRDRPSHEIALEVRELVKNITDEEGANLTIVEMPPGPPVLRSVVAEVYAPDENTRKKLANDLTHIFNESKSMADVDNLMRDRYLVWHFEVDTEKAHRYGVSVHTVKETMEMAMSGFDISTIRKKNALEPTKIRLQVPLNKRSQFSYLKQLPVPSTTGLMIPLLELGRFSLEYQDDLIFHKDLMPVEFVLGEPIGRLSAPIYAMSAVEDLLEKYETVDGETISGEYLDRPTNLNVPSFVWAGEWTITYETFRDMGLAFGVALIIIYMLVVYQFGNFIVPSVIMAPIPLTLLGIIPGHWLLNADFTATSMIGWIALSGIIVRNSILLVDFTVQDYAKGVPFFEAVVNSCGARTRPILITALTLVGGSALILFDPIFQGMAISLLFGVMISTLLTLIVIPLGTLSVGEKHCKVVAINLGLLPGDDSADDKYNIHKTEKENNITKPDAKKAKEWIKTIIKDKPINSTKKISEKKINTDDFLKKEG